MNRYFTFKVPLAIGLAGAVILVFGKADYPFTSSHASDKRHEHHEGKKTEIHQEHSEAGEEHDAHEEEGNARFGPGKAIVGANKKNGIQLSEVASKTLGLSHLNVSGKGSFQVPLSAVVYFQDEVGIYRLRGGWHKLIEVEQVYKRAGEVIIRTSELNSGDQIVKSGVPLLRAAELEAWGGSGDGHGH